MKILFYGHQFAPEVTGIGKYSGELVEWLIMRGHDVRAVVPPPFYPQWRVQTGYRQWWWQRHREVGAIVTRCPVYVPRAPTALSRIAHLASFAVTSGPITIYEGIRFRPDIVATVEPTNFIHPCALLAAWFAGAAAWLHVQDLELAMALNLGILPAGLAGVLSRIERMLTRRFDLVTTISHRMLEKVAARGVTTEYFPNWVDTAAIYPGIESTRERFGLPSEGIIALYSGSFGKKQQLDKLVASIAKAPSKVKITYVFCGSGPIADELKILVGNVANIRFLPLQPVERLNDLLNSADIHMLPQNGGANDLVMPSKLGPMLASARPVVAATISDSEIAHVIGDAGLIVPPNDAASFVHAVQHLAVNDAERQRRGFAARDRAIEFFDKEKTLHRIEERLFSLLVARAKTALITGVTRQP